jgi:hypothetical protein
MKNKQSQYSIYNQTLIRTQNMKTVIITILTIIAFVRPSLAQDTVASYSLQTVVTSYLNLKNALAKDRPDSAQFYSKLLLIQIDAVSEDSLPENRVAIWNKHTEELANSATLISKSAALKKQRKAFGELSVYLYTALKELRMNTASLFYQYCPMADAYWISEQEKVVNPYFGKQMPSCGSTKETLTSNDR